MPEPARTTDPLTRRVIAMMNQKGGVGKTTTTVNVGAAMADAGARVLLIDLDPQAHLTLSVGMEPAEMDKTNYDLFVDEDTTAMEVVREVESIPNLAVLPAETNLAGIESEMAEFTQAGTGQSILRDKCVDLFNQFDAVLIDCPPALGLLTVNALCAATEVIVPMQSHFLAMQGMSKLFETIGAVREGINPTLRVSGVVLCMHEANTLLAGEIRAELDGFFEQAGEGDAWAGAQVYEPAVRRNIKLAEYAELRPARARRRAREQRRRRLPQARRVDPWGLNPGVAFLSNDFLEVELAGGSASDKDVVTVKCGFPEQSV